MNLYLHTKILEGNIYEIIDIFCIDLITNIEYYNIIPKNDEYNSFKNELLYIIVYIKNDFINKEYEYSTCQCLNDAVCIRDKESCKYDTDILTKNGNVIKAKYINISNMLKKFINIFRKIYYTEKYNEEKEELKKCIMIIIYGLYNLWNTINIVALYSNSFRNNFEYTDNSNFAISSLIIFLNFRKEIKQRYFYCDKYPEFIHSFNFLLMDEYILNNNQENINLYKFAAIDMIKHYITLLDPVKQPQIELRGGNIKYKNTENKITVIYNKKKYTRVIYINNKKKYVKINKTFILLSKLKKV